MLIVMSPDDLRALFSALAENGVTYALVGGMAVSMHGLVRTTEDVDLFVEPTEENIARLRRALRGLYDDPDADAITLADLMGDYPVIRYLPPTGAPIDIISRLGERFTFGLLTTETKMLEGVPVTVVSPHSLYAMKVDTVRPQDALDASRLNAAFNLAADDE